eukprot:scaffold2181_cov153-Amphora_coffeaeformis.AAC.2
MTNRPLVTTSRNHEKKQVSELGESDEYAEEQKVIVDQKKNEGKQTRQAQQDLPLNIPSTEDTVEDDDDDDDDENDDSDSGYRMSVEAHLLKEDEWQDEDDSLETTMMEETSVRSWKSLRSWNQRRRRASTPTAPPRVEIYVDIAQDPTMPRTSSASAIRSNNNINPPHRNQDLAHLLATVPSSEEAAAPAAADAFSIQSKSVFTRDDFAQSDWLSVMTTNSGYVGLGVIALTISVTHPIMFLAATLTALGTATAVGASYDCFVQMAPCCTTDQTLSTEDAVATEGATAKDTEAESVSLNSIGAETSPTTLTPPPTMETPVRQLTPSKLAVNSGWIDAKYPALEFAVIENQSLDGLNVMAVLEMKTTLADIPFCDRFYVLERWILTAAKDAYGVYHLKISSRASVILTKSCPFATQIQTKSRSSLTDVGRAWCHMAKQALQLAEQAKLDRLHHHEHDDDDDEDNDDDDDDENERQTDSLERPEQAPIANKPSSDLETYAEEKKEEEHARTHNDENIELIHSFARQTSWVMGEEDTTSGVQMESSVRSLEEPRRTRSRRRFLPKRSPRVISSSTTTTTTTTTDPRRGLSREASADF